MKWIITFIMATVTSRRHKISNARFSGYLLQLQIPGPSSPQPVAILTELPGPQVDTWYMNKIHNASNTRLYIGCTAHDAKFSLSDQTYIH
jgi:hypothetical protein